MSLMKNRPAREAFVSALNSIDSTRTTYSLKEVYAAAEASGVARKDAYNYAWKQPRPTRGQYDFAALVLPLRSGVEQEAPVQQSAPAARAPAGRVRNAAASEDVYVPQVDPTYVKWGNSKDIEQIVKSRAWFPVYVSGLSGNGKTMMIEQACAKAKREFVRIQITPETDEDDLIGGFRLIDGETVFAEGPVIRAMKTGAVLLIDEIDRGSNKIMCLQGVLEGKPVMIKKTGEVVTPSEGFNVIATANTKGQGSDSGRFIAATIIDEAFLERFVINIEQPYPSKSIEKKIIMNHMDKFDCVDEEFANHLVFWADTIRATYNAGGIDEVIATRRLCHIIQTFSIFKSREKAVDLCVARFDEDTREAFMDLYSKIDPTASIDEEVA